MARSNFDACLAIVLDFEGGLSMVRSDPGNWTGGRVGKGILRGTKYGIAASAHPTLDIAALTKAGAGAIYRADYWEAIGGDALSAGVDLAVFDPAVNSGPARARAWLGAARATSADPAAIITAICAARLSVLHALSTWRAFGRGWGVRVAAVEAKAHRMALGGTPAASAALEATADRARARAASATRRAGAGAGGALAGPVGAHQALQGHHALGVVLAVGLAGALAASVLAFTAWRHRQRAAAFATEVSTLEPRKDSL